MIREKLRPVSSGWGIFGVLLAINLAALFGIYLSVEANNPAGIMTSIVVAVLAALMYAGLFIVNPNEAKVLQLFGDYKGTVGRGASLGQPVLHQEARSRCVSATSRAPSSRSTTTRQPDRDRRGRRLARRRHRRSGLPGRHYENYVHVQSESALRNLATHYPYDAHDGRMSLRGNTAESPTSSSARSRSGSAKAGVEVIEARISHLAYAPEIAAAMLQRQQASAIIAARQRIVEGAVGMVEMALDMLAKRASSSSTRSGRPRWSATCWSCSAASATPSPSSTPARSTMSRGGRRTEALPAPHRSGVLEALQRWANDDLRSLNGQIEFLLRRALQGAGRLRPAAPGRQAETRELRAMDRRAFLNAIGSARSYRFCRALSAITNFSRRRPSDPAWPSQSAWKQLNEAVGGNLMPVDFPLSVFKTDPDGAQPSFSPRT